MTRSGRCRDERGVTIVEAAFAFPILLMFMFGLVDLGMWTFNSNQATNAARDGARMAVLDFETADDEGSPMHALVVAAVEQRLDRTVEADEVSVSCVSPTGATIDCGVAEVDLDSVRVDVEWDWNLVTPIAAVLGYDEGAAVGSATMKLIGRPLSTTAPVGTTTTTVASTSDCAVVEESLEVPDSVERKRQGETVTKQLAAKLPISFTTTGTCSELVLEIVSPSTDETPVRVSCGCEARPKTAGKYEFSYTGSDNIWTSFGVGQVNVYAGAALLKSAAFQVN